MLNTKASSSDNVSSVVTTGAGSAEGMRAGGVFHFVCRDKDGNIKWEEKTHNLVVNVGLQHMNATFFEGSSYNAAWYLGLIQGPSGSVSLAASDTLILHVGWTEDSNYSGNRPLLTFGTATTADPSVIDNSGSPASFAITGTTTISGAFLASVASGTSGILFSESLFASPGDRSVVSGDTLNVTYTFSLDAA